MDKIILSQLKSLLEKERTELENNLENFAKKNDGEWQASYPDIAPGENLEDQANEVEEYENILPVERALEKKLKDVVLALEKMEIGTYGKCENCDKDIPIERLLAFPEARSCNECKE